MSRSLFRLKVDGSVLRPQHDNLRTVSQSEGDSARHKEGIHSVNNAHTPCKVDQIVLWTWSHMTLPAPRMRVGKVKWLQ